MLLPYPPAIPWILVVWTFVNGDVGANQMRYYPSQHECLIAKQAVIDIYQSITAEEGREMKIIANCMPSIITGGDQDEPEDQTLR